MSFVRVHAAAGAACLALALGGLSGPAAAQAPSHLRIGLGSDADILDPTFARSFVGRFVFASLCDKLFDIDDKLAVVPQLALAHETSADGKTVTIRLRPGVRFHDGEPMDAEAVRFSLDRHLTATGSFRRPELSAIDTITVVDPLTVRLNLKTPFAPLVAQLTDRAGMIVSPKAVREAGERFGQKPVCAGPYRFVSRVQQGPIVVERFPDYWNKDAVKIDRVTYVPIPDSTVRLANLKSGQLDLIERALATDLPELKADRRFRTTAEYDLGWYSVTVNVGNGEAAKTPLGRDVRLRRALDAAIDRDALNQVVFGGAALPGNQFVSPTNPWFQAKYPVPKRDLARAKALVAQSGVPTPIPVDFLIQNDPEVRQAAEIVQAMAAEAGFDLKIRVTEFATMLNEQEAGRFGASIVAWSGRADPDGNIYVFAKTGAVQNYGRFSNAEADRLLDEARSTTGRAERMALYERLTGVLLEETPVIYLYHRPVIVAHTTRLEGFKPYPDGLVRVVGLSFK